jgi:hypothetical protein
MYPGHQQACRVPPGGSTPAGLRSRNLLMGEAWPSGCNSSILVLGSSTNTTVTPCSGTGFGADTCTTHMHAV